MLKTQLLNLIKASDWSHWRYYWYTLTFPKGSAQTKTPKLFLATLAKTYKISSGSWYVSEKTKNGTIHFHGILKVSVYQMDDNPIPTPHQMSTCWPWRSQVDRLYKHYKVTTTKRYVLESVIAYIFKENTNATCITQHYLL